jgi:hypothetical protein
MATTSAFPTLAIPEDTMEMSSPGNVHDVDIDLDFGDGDFGDGGVQLHQDDEPMLTDGEQTRPPTATDAMMDEDVHVESHTLEADMQDTPELEHVIPEQHDEELIDYGDEEYDLDQHDDTTLVNADEAFNNAFEGQHTDLEPVDEEIVRPPEDLTQTQDFGIAVESFAEQPAAAAVGDLLHEHDSAEYDGTHDPSADAVSQLAAATEAEFGNHTEPALTTGEDESQYAADEGATINGNDANVEDQPGTPTDTGLHPMVVYFGEHVMPLFKSKNQPEGLLKDDNLASLSLHDLLRHCRERLALKIGNIPEDQELSLVFDRMGLMLVEVRFRMPGL